VYVTHSPFIIISGGFVFHVKPSHIVTHFVVTSMYTPFIKYLFSRIQHFSITLARALIYCIEERLRRVGKTEVGKAEVGKTEVGTVDTAGSDSESVTRAP
jgi:hypothetical protein